MNVFLPKTFSRYLIRVFSARINKCPSVNALGRKRTLVYGLARQQRQSRSLMHFELKFQAELLSLSQAGNASFSMYERERERERERKRQRERERERKKERRSSYPCIAMCSCHICPNLQKTSEAARLKNALQTQRYTYITFSISTKYFPSSYSPGHIW